MKRTIWTGTCTVIVGLATAALVAQTPATQPSNSQPSSEHRVTVTGCLKAAPGSEAPAAAAATGTTGTTATTGTTGTTAATGTTGTTAAAAAPAPDPSTQKFVLTDALMTTAESSAATTTAGGATTTAGTTGTTGTTAAGATTAAASTTSGSAPQTYRLIANGSALSPHVGKKLELIGTLENQASAASTTNPSTTAGAESNLPALRVESGKVVAATCTEK